MRLHSSYLRHVKCFRDSNVARIQRLTILGMLRPNFGYRFSKEAEIPDILNKRRVLWTLDDHDRFLTAVEVHGKDWSKIAQYIGTKNYKQVVRYAQKFCDKVRKSEEPNRIKGAELVPILRQRLVETDKWYP